MPSWGVRSQKNEVMAAEKRSQHVIKRTHGPMNGLWHKFGEGSVPKAQENSGKMLEDQNQMESKQIYAKM